VTEQTPYRASRLLVVTPWYPTADEPYHGSFVRESVAALDHPSDATTIVQVRSVSSGSPSAVIRQDSPLGPVVRIDVPLDPMTPRVDTALAHRTALMAARDAGELPELAAADVVHAHVGMPSGYAVSELLAPAQRFVTTEHATYLSAVLRLPQGLAAYRAMLERADVHLTVSRAQARDLRRTFPDLRERIDAIGNPVDDARFGPRSAPVRIGEPLLRWVYVGNLVERKNVRTILDALAIARPECRLTVIGDGPQREELEAHAAALGVSQRVTWYGAARPDELPGLLGAQDVLVHLSDYETFGLTVVEAAMTGLPVVVTRSAGPPETLSDAVEQGLVALVRVKPSPDEVVAALAGLAQRQAECDHTAVRNVLVDRYGTAAYRRALRHHLFDESPSPAISDRKVVLLATSDAGARALVPVQAEAVRCGARVQLVTPLLAEATAAEPAVDVLYLSPGVVARPWLTFWRCLEAGPTFVLRSVRRVCQLVTSLPGPLTRPAARGGRAMSHLISRWQRTVDHVRSAAHDAAFARLESRLLPAAARRTYPGWSVSPGDIVVLGDRTASPLAQSLLSGRQDGVVVLRPPTDWTLRAALTR